jgi:hypothetical protein
VTVGTSLVVIVINSIADSAHLGDVPIGFALVLEHLRPRRQ